MPQNIREWPAREIISFWSVDLCEFMHNMRWFEGLHCIIFLTVRMHILSINDQMLFFQNKFSWSKAQRQNRLRTVSKLYLFFVINNTKQ